MSTYVRNKSTTAHKSCQGAFRILKIQWDFVRLESTIYLILGHCTLSMIAYVFLVTGGICFRNLIVYAY